MTDGPWARVNERERLIEAEYEAIGYTAYHQGAPDFLMVKYGPTGLVVDSCFVEVKSPTDRLSPQQIVWKSVLQQHHKYFLRVVQDPQLETDRFNESLYRSTRNALRIADELGLSWRAFNEAPALAASARARSYLEPCWVCGNISWPTDDLRDQL